MVKNKSENGISIKCMALASLPIRMVILIMGTSRVITKKDMELISGLVETDLQAKDLKQRFNIDSPLGSWFVQLHCESLELFQSIKQYGFHGFSIQGAFEDVLIHLNNSNNNNNIMNKIIEMNNNEQLSDNAI